MQISAKARLISIIIAVVFMFGALAGTGAYLIVNHLNNANATTQSADATIGNLFNTDGSLNAENVSKFLTKLQYTSITSSTTLTSPQIASRTGSGGSFVFQMGYFVDSSGAINTSKPINWQATYLRNGYLTIWMTQPYTNGYYNYNGRTVNAFDPGNDHSGSSNGLYYNNYSMSQLRDITKNIYTLLSNKFTTLNTIITAPSTASSAWQSSQNDVYTTASSSDYAHHNGMGSNSGSSYSWGSSTGTAWSSCMSDVFWIPSAYEVFNTASGSGDRSDTNGLWGLTAADNRFSATTLDGSSTSYCWLRSGFSSADGNAMRVNSSGSANYGNVRYGYGVRPACHISLSALANAASYTITAQSNNTNYGTVSGGGMVQMNSSVTITATPNTGYHFVRWESNGATVSTSAEYTFTATASGTYTAIFEPNSYTITANISPVGAGSVTGGGVYNYNTQATLSATTNSGYEFLGWDINGNNQYDSDEPTANPYTFTVTGDATITAIFRQLINITIRTNNAEYGQIFVNGGLTTSTTLTQDANTQINNIMAIAKNNCAFLYWYDESNGNVYYDNPLNYTITQSTTLTAYFGSGLVEGVAVSVECPDTPEVVAAGEARIIGYTNYNGIDYVHFSAVAYTGYRFVGWRVDGEILADYTTESANIPYSIVENKQVFAVFLPLENTGNINDSTDNGQTDDF